VIDRIDVSEAMIAAAQEAGKRSGAFASTARHADVRRVLQAALGAMSEELRGARFDLVVSTGITRKKARFFGASHQRGYLYVECEDGQRLHVHANEIEPAGRQR
jgi:hypothetical protein